MSDLAARTLPAQAIAAIQQVLAACPAVEQALLYGSRAKGNYKRGSDIDLTLKGEALTYRDLLHMARAVQTSDQAPKRMPRTARHRGRGALLAGLHWFQTWQLLASTDGSSPKSRSQVSLNVERLLSDFDFSKLRDRTRCKAAIRAIHAQARTDRPSPHHHRVHMQRDHAPHAHRPDQ